jgi:hypothetical protein
VQLRICAIGLLACTALAACGESGGPREVSDPQVVSEEFVRAVAAGDPGACEFLASAAAEFVTDASGLPSCEQAIERHRAYELYGDPPATISEELGDGRLDLTKSGAIFLLCTPRDLQIRLELAKAIDGWVIESVQTSYQSKVTAGGGEEKRRPCILD